MLIWLHKIMWERSVTEDSNLKQLLWKPEIKHLSFVDYDMGKQLDFLYMDTFIH